MKKQDSFLGDSPEVELTNLLKKEDVTLVTRAYVDDKVKQIVVILQQIVERLEKLEGK
jgi:hypothetical protein